MLLNDGEAVTVRIKFDTAQAGNSYLIHCHKLEHEDAGMIDPPQRGAEQRHRLPPLDPPAKRYKKVDNATAVISKTLLIPEHTFRRLDAPELLAEVAEGVVYINGVRQRAEAKHAAA